MIVTTTIFDDGCFRGGSSCLALILSHSSRSISVVRSFDITEFLVDETSKNLFFKGKTCTQADEGRRG